MMEIAAIISFLVLVVTWMGLPGGVRTESVPTLQVHATPAKA